VVWVPLEVDAGVVVVWVAPEDTEVMAAHSSC